MRFSFHSFIKFLMRQEVELLQHLNVSPNNRSSKIIFALLEVYIQLPMSIHFFFLAF